MTLGLKGLKVRSFGTIIEINMNTRNNQQSCSSF